MDLTVISEAAVGIITLIVSFAAIRIFHLKSLVQQFICISAAIFLIFSWHLLPSIILFIAVILCLVFVLFKYTR